MSEVQNIIDQYAERERKRRATARAAGRFRVLEKMDQDGYISAEDRHLNKIKRGHSVRVRGLEGPHVVLNRRSRHLWVRPVDSRPEEPGIEVRLEDVTHVRVRPR